MRTIHCNPCLLPLPSILSFSRPYLDLQHFQFQSQMQICVYVHSGNTNDDNSYFTFRYDRTNYVLECKNIYGTY